MAPGLLVIFALRLNFGFMAPPFSELPFNIPPG